MSTLLHKNIGNVCRYIRISKGYTLCKVADDLCYTAQNIANFESGFNRNYDILLWYIAHGLTSKTILAIIQQTAKGKHLCQRNHRKPPSRKEQ